jgi:AcrR family transcriptional regulator
VTTPTASSRSAGQTPPRGVERALARQRAKYEAEVVRLLEATLAVMRDQDTDDPTVNDILQRAGLSTAAFYRHFPTKDDLLVALLDQAHEMTSSHIEQRLNTVRDPQDRVDVWVRAVFDLVRTEESLTSNRSLLLAHPRLLRQFPHEISTGFAVLAWPLQVAITDARAALGLPAGDAALDSRLALHQVFGILVDAAAIGLPPSRDVIDGVVSYTLRAVLSSETTRRKTRNRAPSGRR